MAKLDPSVFGAPRDWAIDLACATAIGLFLGALGPFGSYFNGPPAERIAYWVASLWIGSVILGLATRLAAHGARATGAPLWACLALVTLIADVPLSLTVALVAREVWPFLRIAPLEWYGQTLILSTPIVIIYGWLRARPAMARAPAVPTPGPVTAADQAADAALGPALCLQMEDHYVRVHRAGGSRLVLATMAQAVEAAGAEGLRVHRSWWVARAAVARVEPDGRNLRLRLTNGLTVPVARAQVAALRAAGWLER